MSAFKELTAFSRMPLVTADRGVVLRPGFDAETGVFAAIDAELVEGIDPKPDRGAVLSALRSAWGPWSAYRWAPDDDRAGMFSGLLLALARPGMETAPGLIFDAPVQGSGKTYAAQALGALVLDRRCPTTAFGMDDTELKKTLVATCLDGYPLMLVDNVVGFYDSAVLANLITSGRLRERVLGASVTFDGPARLLMMLTGNNATLSRDLTRRFVRARIDHCVEAPQALTFRFNPAQRALDERMVIVRSLVTIFQAFFAAGVPRLGRGGSTFPDWHRLVRSCVLWLAREGLDVESGIGRFGDPAMMELEQAGRDDPESAGLASLLHGLRGVFKDASFRSREVARLLDAGYDDALLIREGLEAIWPEGAKRGFSSVTIGRLLAYRRDRITDGLVLRQLPGEKKTVNFTVVPV